jgi:hypothetical protein
MKKLNLDEKTNCKNLDFNSKAVKISELEERKEMIVLWRRGDGALPKDQTHTMR